MKQGGRGGGRDNVFLLERGSDRNSVFNVCLRERGVIGEGDGEVRGRG